MRQPETKCDRWTRGPWLAGAAIFIAVTGLAGVASADDVAVPISTTTTVYARASWVDAMAEPIVVVVDEDTGTDSAYAAAITPYGPAGASGRIDVTNSGGVTNIATRLFTEGYALDDGDAEVEIQDGTIVVGTSAQYPAGTPLALTLAATITYDDNPGFPYHHLRLYRGSDIILDVQEDSAALCREWTCVVYAGETLTPWLRQSASGNNESGAVVTSIDMWTTVPEPASLALLMFGGLVLRRR